MKPRIWSASIPLNDNQLLITGGLSGPNSMEIVDINEETSTELSVNLTMDFWRHCIAQVKHDSEGRTREDWSPSPPINFWFCIIYLARNLLFQKILSLLKKIHSTLNKYANKNK